MNKNTSELANNQLRKENQTLTSLLLIGFIGSACVHAIAMITPVPSFWKPVSKDGDIMEVVVNNDKTTKDKATEDKTSAIAKEPELIAPLATSEESAPAAIALAPETKNSVKEGQDAPAPDNLKPLLSNAPNDSKNDNKNDINKNEFKIQQGGGRIIRKDGTGSGFGNAKTPTGFVPSGKINGNPNGKKDGVIGGYGNQNGQGSQANTSPPTPTSPINSTDVTDKKNTQLECLSCPKPQYRGKEGTPRVIYDITPDGRATNVRLRQSSGDAQTDRETLETMSKWQFNPQTIPQGGRTDVKVRVTFEEEGSQFQRQNEERRRENAAPPVNLTPERSLSSTPTAPVVETNAATPQPSPVINTTPVPPQPAQTINAPLSK